MIKEKMDRISELTRISRERELTEEEKIERQALREEYLAEDGTIVPLPKKKK